MFTSYMEHPGVEEVGRVGQRGRGGRQHRHQALRGREHLAQGRRSIQQVTCGRMFVLVSFRLERRRSGACRCVLCSCRRSNVGSLV